MEALTSNTSAKMTPKPTLSPAVQKVLWSAALLAITGMLGASFTLGHNNWVRLFDNLHWTAGTWGAATLAWLGYREHAPHHSKSLPWMVAGLTGYAAGQLLWDVQVLASFQPFPAPSDVFYLSLGPLVTAGLVRIILEQTSPDQRKVIWLDTLTPIIAFTVALLVLYLPSRGSTSVLALVVLLAYPVTQFAAVCMLVVMVLTLRLRPTPGLWCWIGGMAATCLGWLNWNYMALNGQDYDGAWFNSLFTVGALAMGMGLVLWRMDHHATPRWARLCEGLLRQLPLVSMMAAAGTVASVHAHQDQNESIQLTAELGAIVVVVLSMLRQAVLLKEHDQLKATQASLLSSQRELAHEQGLLRSLVSAMPDLVWMKSTAGVYLSCNAEFERFFGIKEADILGKSDHDFFNAEEAEKRVRGDQAAIHQGKPDTEERWLHSLNGQAHALFQIIKTPAHDPQGQLIGVVGIARDITKIRQTQNELLVAAVAFESQQPTVVTDEHGVILRVNQAFIESTGYTAQEAVGQTPRLLTSGRHNDAFYASMWATIHATGCWQGEVWDKRKNGEVYPKWMTISAVKNVDGLVTHYIGVHHDITARKKAEEKINALAFFDQLTGLPNRTLLQDRIRQGMALGARDGSHGALLFIDLDQFKTLNDTHGHSAGDALLQEVAQRLTQGVRAQDTVSRLGGDEFIVMLLGLDTQLTEAATHAETIAINLLGALNRPYVLGSITHRCTSSIGVCLFQGQQTVLDDIMRQADLAMYRAKAAGRNMVRFFDTSMETAVMARAALESDLRQAVDENQFELYYQAQVDAQRHVVGAEALVRWIHPRRGMVSPADFIPLAEETGLMLPLGLWVLKTACNQLATWAQTASTGHLSVAVNVSAQQFQQRDFVAQVKQALADTGAPARRLKLELTESLLVADVDDIIQKMRELQIQGVSFSLDDFGTGFSSLTYLKRLPLNQLKIDRSFVRDVLDDLNDAAIARTIVSLAHSLKLDVVAEGVETTAQRHFLESIGCGLFQGYLFAQPQPVARFETWLTQGSATHVPSPEPEQTH